MYTRCYRALCNTGYRYWLLLTEIVATRSNVLRTFAHAPAWRNCLRARPGHFALVFALALYAAPAVAEIRVDTAAPQNQQPTLIKSANGTPQVDIQTPTAAGVSRNAYKQFDVDRRGVILNNSRTATRTQLGGFIGGNQNLVRGEARVILNEVHARNPSQLKGFVEVGGKRAEVIVANPAGITCNGCGFINASKGTLTTGTPQFEHGNLTGYSVNGGKVVIEGKGLNATDADYSAIIARAVEINAEVHARAIRATTGLNDTDTAGNVTASRQSDTDKPLFALDVAELGGMYANKIRLIGTEHGVGVRNAGHLGASAGELVLTAEGKLLNKGHISVHKRAQIRAGGVTNTGSIASKSSLQVHAANAVDNQGVMAADKQLTIQAGKAGIRNAGDIGAGGDLTLSSGGKLTNSGRMSARGNAKLALLKLINPGSIYAQGKLHIDSAGAVDNRGQLIADQALTLRAGGDVDTAGDMGAGGDLLLAARGKLSNSGRMSARGNAKLALLKLINPGSIYAQGKLHIDSAGAVDNRGQLIADQALTLRAGGDVGNTGDMGAGGNLTLATESKLANSGRISAQSDAVITTGGIDNPGSFYAHNNLRVQNSAALLNQGRMVAKQALVLVTDSLDNTHGGEIAAPDLAVTATAELTNRGLIDGKKVLLHSAKLNNVGTGRIYGSHLALAADVLNNLAENGKAATLAARERLDIATHELSNRDAALIFSAGDLAIGGKLDSERHATGRAVRVLNSSAIIEALGDLSISAHTLENRDDYYRVVTDTLVKDEPHREYAWNLEPQVRYDESEITFFGDAEFYNRNGVKVSDYYIYDFLRTITQERIADAQPGQLLAGGNLKIDADRLLNDQSRIIAGNKLLIHADTITNKERKLVRTTTDRGTVQFTWIESCGMFGGNHCREHASRTPYNPIQREYTPITGTLAGHTQPNGSGTQVGSLVVSGSKHPNGILSGNGILSRNSLFRYNPVSSNQPLIETDPRFSSYYGWLNSSYALRLLQIDPGIMHRRLGDGLIEQELVREQLAELTGLRYLPGYSNDEEQYRALLEAGVTFAQEFGIAPGVALSAEQMQQLTTDIVWLVHTKVKTPDGRVETVLVPQVYALVQPGDLSGDGALLAGRTVQLNLSDTLTNSGRIVGTERLILKATDIANARGVMRGERVRLDARRDIRNRGGLVQARERLDLIAGRDIELASLTSSTEVQVAGNHFERTVLDGVGELQVTGKKGVLVAAAGNDIRIDGGVIEGGQLTALQAGRDIALGTVETGKRDVLVWDARNSLYDARRDQVGSRIQGPGDLVAAAGRDIRTRGAYINQGGDLAVYAERDIDIGTAKTSEDYESRRYVKSSGFLSSSSSENHYRNKSTTTNASVLSAERVDLVAERDLGVQGSHVVGSDDVSLNAGQDIRIGSAGNTRHSERYNKERKSGVFTSGGVGFTVGSRHKEDTVITDSTTQVGSSIGSVGGDVRIQAGKKAHITASEVLAPGGNIVLQGEQVTLDSGTNSYRRDEVHKFRQSGLSVSVTNPVISAVQTIEDMHGAVKDTDDERMQALAAATAGLAVKNAYDQVMSNPSQVGGVNLNVGIGSSKSESRRHSEHHTAVGSKVAAGGDVVMQAVGAGTESDLRIVGSEVRAGANVLLHAEDAIDLEAAANTGVLRGSNRSSGAGVGISVGTNPGVTFSAHKGKGRESGNDLSWTETQVSAGNRLYIASGGDTRLRGAIASGERVIAKVGGNLYLESLQDRSHYDSEQKNVGGSITVGPNPGVGLNYGRTQLDSDYVSVIEQTGIHAGDGGFRIDVEGNTDLKGAVITSNQAAVDADKNRLTTGSLTTSVLENRAQYEGKSVGLGVGYSHAGGVGKNQEGDATSGGEQTPGTVLPDLGGFSATLPVALEAEDEAKSTTRSGISGAAINITDQSKQDSSEQQLALIERDVLTGKDTANALDPIFDQEEIEAGFAITGAFVREVGTFAALRAKEADALKDKADQAETEANDPNLSREERQAKLDEALRLNNEATSITDDWGPGGAYRRVLTALATAASGNISGSGAQMLQNAAVSYIQSLAAEQVKRLADQLDSEEARAALQALIGCAGAAASGHSCGAGAAGAAAGVVLSNVFSKLGDADNLTNAQKEGLGNLVTTLVTGVTDAAGGDVAATNIAARIEAENNSLLKGAKAVYKTTKAALESYKKHGKVKLEDLKKSLKDQGLDIADDLITLTDEEINFEDALAVVDLVIGTEFGNVSKGKAAQKIARMVGKKVPKRGADWAKLNGKLRDAAKGKGDFGIGSGTRGQADKMGKAWVGEGYKVARDGKTLISADGLRQYRPPKYKPRLDKTQANFEQRFPGQQSNRWQSNAHLDITD